MARANEYVLCLKMLLETMQIKPFEGLVVALGTADTQTLYQPLLREEDNAPSRSTGAENANHKRIHYNRIYRIHIFTYIYIISEFSRTGLSFILPSVFPSPGTFFRAAMCLQSWESGPFLSFFLKVFGSELKMHQHLVSDWRPHLHSVLLPPENPFLKSKESQWYDRVMKS
jgi:hypothetical protein